MKLNQTNALRWCVVATFAVAMAWVEAAVVFYLRTMVARIEPHQTNPLPFFGGLAQTELPREAATLIMLFAVGVLAGRTWRSRFGFMAVAFGVWDIFYYVFLKVMTGWPNSLLDWDILFLLPLPWWGPVLAPIFISLLMIAWGSMAIRSEPAQPVGVFTVAAWGTNFIGILLALYVFMADTLRVADQGRDAIRNVLPSQFNWPLFCIAVGLMCVPLAGAVRGLMRIEEP